jgi:molybdenum cofactor biosynthesis enzyme MoaA
MKIQTMSIVCGTTACNARCPYCVSRTTPSTQLSTQVNWKNLDVACRLAERSGATTCLITGKGEPTLYPDLITSYLYKIRKYFPLIELQTNAIRIGDGSLDRIGIPNGFIDPISYLGKWIDHGLTTIAISAVSWKRGKNQEIYGENYPELAMVCDKLHRIGYSIRLSVIMIKNCIDTPLAVMGLCDEARAMGIEQLTIRSVHAPENGKGKEVEWIKSNRVDAETNGINEYLRVYATEVLRLPHGAIVYDLDGQNICLANCLTTDSDNESMRQIIFYPNGTIGYSWVYPGARLL